MNQMARLDKFQRLIEQCSALPPTPTAVAHPCDESSLEGAVEAARLKIIAPTLVGPAIKIRALAESCRLDISGIPIVDVPHSHAAAAKAVELVRIGQAEALMKGSLHTDELMGEVVSMQGGMRTGRRISHCFVMDVPALPHPIIVTDAAVNIAPTLEEKVDIIQNAIDLAVALGFRSPLVAILSAVEMVTPKVPSTVEAAALCKMAGAARLPVEFSMVRWRWITPSTCPPPRSSNCIRRLQGMPTFWWCRTWRLATCWPRVFRFWPVPMLPASFSAPRCPSS
jgi:phosphate acetyltransferase